MCMFARARVCTTMHAKRLERNATLPLAPAAGLAVSNILINGLPACRCGSTLCAVALVHVGARASRQGALSREEETPNGQCTSLR